MLEITTSAKVRERGERLVITSWETAKSSRALTSMAHLQRYEWVLTYLKGLSCLDAGCGSGYGTYYLAQNGVGQILGVDVSSPAIRYAQEHYTHESLAFLRMDICALGFELGSLDAVISFDVLEHLDEERQHRFLSESARAVSEGGIAVLGCPNATVSTRRNPHHPRELSSQDFEDILKVYYKSVRLFGQDLVINGVRQEEDWYRCLSRISYDNLLIVERDSDLAYGLLAICSNPKMA